MTWENFDWGEASDKQKNSILQEHSNKIYEQKFEVEENDVVVDIGAFVGDFTYSILHKNPEHCWVIEPVKTFYKTMYNNLKNNQVSFTRGAISDKEKNDVNWDGSNSTGKGIIFKEFIDDNCIEKIDFLKTDCEGGEYFIFTEENFDYIKNNVRKIVGEFHLKDNSIITDIKNKFLNFRDNFLIHFDNYHVISVDGVNIKWDLFNDHFLEYYTEVIIHIDNERHNN